MTVPVDTGPVDTVPVDAKQAAAGDVVVATADRLGSVEIGCE
jgi:hypothetical protein